MNFRFTPVDIWGNPLGRSFPIGGFELSGHKIVGGGRELGSILADGVIVNEAGIRVGRVTDHGVVDSAGFPCTLHDLLR